MPPSQNNISRSCHLLLIQPSVETRRLAQPLPHRVNPSFMRRARQQHLDGPLSSYQARLGREAAYVCKPSLLLGQLLLDSPRQLGPLWLLSFCPKITIGFDGALGMNRTTLMRACGSLRTGRACSPSLFPQGTRAKVGGI